MMAFPSFESWQAPWDKKGEEFDAENAAKYIYNLHKDADTAKATRATEKAAAETKISELEAEKAELETKVTEFEDKDLPEVDRLRKELERVKAASTPAAQDQTSSLEAARLRIALREGLTEKQAARLVGDSEEALLADAKAYKEEHGLDSADDGDGDGAHEDGGGEMPSQGRLIGGFGPSDMGAGNSLDPDKLADAGIGRY